METKEVRAVISSTIRRSMMIAFIIYEIFILLMGILGFIVGYKHVSANCYWLDWWFFLGIAYRNVWHGHYQNDFYIGNLFLAISIILIFMLILPVIYLIINRRKQELSALTANEKEIVGSYTAFIPISKITLKMPIEKIDNIAAGKSIFNFFTGENLRIASTSGVIKIPFVANANEVVAFIYDAIEKAKNSSQTSAERGIPQVDVADSLKKFAELRDSGILTEEEFTQKKNELLGK